MTEDQIKPTKPSQRLDDALREQQELLSVTLSSIGDAVIATDIHGCITFLNPVAESLTGWTQAEAVGTSLAEVFQIVHESTHQPAENPATKALRAGVIVGLSNHTLLIAKDGTQWPIEDSAAPIRDAKGQVAGVVLVFRDVTERRRKEKLAEDALAYADNILATLREPFLVLDQSLRVVTANRSFYDKFHVEAEETQGRFIYDLGNRQWDILQLRLLLEDVLPQSHAFENFSVEHEFASIGKRYMLLNARRIPKPGNHSELILLAIEDVTERRQTQQQLVVSETRFRRLFETAHDGILILNAASQKITHVNPFLTDLLDYPAEHFLGKELWEIGFLRDKEASQSAMQQLYDKGEIRYESLPLEDSHGRLHPVEMVANVYDEGHHRVIQCNIRDISVRSGLEKLLRGQASELSDLHRRKDEFLAMLSHELRSPLAPIASALQLLGLQRGSENRIQQQARGVIERQLAQLQHLVDDLLEVSRITTGRVQLRREMVAVSDIVAGAVETVRPLIEQRRHELTVSLSPRPIRLHADAARLEQVLVNLLTNAAKYTEEEGHIWLTVELASGGRSASKTEPPDTTQDECILRVRDTGVGIAPALLPRIFDLFTQAERSLDRSQGGLGIGLALVHRLTELHGGTVEVNSTLGEGSEFIVHLPVMTVEPPPAESPAADPGPVAARPLRVLVVDDNSDTVLTFAILLKALGHDVRTAHDGPSGVAAALSYRPDVALLDIGLPGLNGYEVAKRIRQEPTLQNAVLVALTGYGQETDREISRQAGFNHHMVKPANFDKLQQILANVADQLT
ncbi:MAG: PAS domain S-box protein [Pirellulaceae bacterium]